MFNIFKMFSKKPILCEKNEICPIYLAYLDKYGENSKQIKYCKNPEKKYCKEYNLKNISDWKKLNRMKKMKIIRDIYLIEFLDKKD